MAERENGCVTNFPAESPRFTIWRNGNHFMAQEFGVGGKLLPIQGDPVFQDLAREVHRLACEVGQLRRKEIESGRNEAAGLAAAEALIADWLKGRADREADGAVSLELSGQRQGSVARHDIRAGALREAAKAVRQGRARREGGA